MIPTIIDSHCHLDLPAFDADRAEVLAAAREVGVRGMVVPAVLASAWSGLLRLCAGEPDLVPALGLHPVYVDEHDDGDVAALAAAIDAHAPVAVGEIGLDFAVDGLDRERQLALFEAQLAVARDARLPVVLHVRKAHDQVLALLRRMRFSEGGIAHAFSGSIDQGRRYRELGFGLGFGGMLTFERSRRLRGLARELPLDGLVLETDAPDLTVASHRGERNSPAYLPEVLESLAVARDADPDEIAAATTANVRRILRLGKYPVTGNR